MFLIADDIDKFIHGNISCEFGASDADCGYIVDSTNVYFQWEANPSNLFGPENEGTTFLSYF